MMDVVKNNEGGPGSSDKRLRFLLHSVRMTEPHMPSINESIVALIDRLDYVSRGEHMLGKRKKTVESRCPGEFTHSSLCWGNW